MAGAERRTVIDSLMNQLGGFGKYQLFIFMLIIVPVCFNAVSTLSYVFTTSSIEQRCKIPECDTSDSEYWEKWVNFSIPFENGIPSKCTRYGPVGQNVEGNSTKCSSEMFTNETLQSCNEFVYKNMERSIASEWNLACPESAWKLTLIGTINNVGQFVGMPLGAFISDRYGRRIALAAGGSFSAVMGIIKSFSTNYEMFAMLEFLDASVGCVIYTTAWIIGVELVAQKRRALACCCLSIFYAIGEISLGIIAKYVQDWRNLIRVLYAPAFIHLIYFCILPESIRWLISQQKTDKVILQLRKIAHVNKRVLSEESLMTLRNIQTVEDEVTEQIYPFTSAFKSPRLLWRIINCSFCWFANTLVYYGLSLNAVTLAGDKYMNFIFTCSIEIPAFLIASFMMDKIGRRISLCGSLLISGATCALAILVQNNNDHIWGLLLYLTGKFAITASFTTLYVYTAEIFPTNIRQSLLSVCSMIGRVGSMLAPQTVLMGQTLTYLPLLLFSACATISGLLTLQFPETNSKELPDTIQEAEKVEKSESS